MKLVKFITIVSLLLSGSFSLTLMKPAQAYSVCGIKGEEASFKTQTYLVTICLGEASYQMIITYPDGTGYKKIPVQREGAKFRGTDGQHNYIIDQQTFVIGTDGEPPIRERVIESQ